jgi:hypothetical protein
MMNANGWAVGREEGNSDGYDDVGVQHLASPLEAWTGTLPLSTLNPMGTPTAINSVGQVLGSSTTATIGACLWTGTQTTSTWQSVTPGSVQSLYQLIPSPLQRLIANTGPIALSGTDQNGNVRILFSANYQTDSAGDWAPGKFLLTLVSGSNPILRRVSFPPNVSPQISSMNSQGVIAGLGDTTGGNAGHALLLVPVQLVDNQYPSTPKTIQPLPAQTSSQTNDQYVQQELSDSCIAYIDPSNGQNGAPNMPQLVASLGSGSSAAISGIPVRWRLEVDYTRPNDFTDYYVTSSTTENVYVPSVDQNGNPAGASNLAFTGTMWPAPQKLIQVL